MPNSELKSAELRRAALDYHEVPTPGKVGSLNVAVACGIALSAVRTAHWSSGGE